MIWLLNTGILEGNAAGSDIADSDKPRIALYCLKRSLKHVVFPQV